MTDWIQILLKAFWCGCAATGFGVLFSVPPKNLAAVWAAGAIAGVVKFSVLFFSSREAIVQSTFLAAIAVSIFSLPVAHRRHEPPKIFAIPAVIPLVPGVFAYRTMLGVIKLSNDIGDDYGRVLSETVHNAVTTLFIIMALAIGVSIPIQVSNRKHATNAGTKK